MKNLLKTKPHTMVINLSNILTRTPWCFFFGGGEGGALSFVHNVQIYINTGIFGNQCEIKTETK